jgi:drug/metabolite transporter (DMT)-like permease
VRRRRRRLEHRGDSQLDGIVAAPALGAYGACVAGNQARAYVAVVLACVGNATANVLQRKASLDQPEQRFGPRLLFALLRSPVWLIAFGSLIASFLLQAVALRFGALSAVEPIITLEVPLTLLIASRVFSGRLSGSDWASILIMTAGMAALVGALGPTGGDPNEVDILTYLVAGAATVGGVAALVLIARRGGLLWRTACLGAAAGTSFGMTATMIKAAMAALAGYGVTGILTAWQAYVAVGFGVTGLILVQAALHAGPLVAAQPGFTLMDPLVSILWGVLIYEEVTRTGGWLILATVGALAIGTAVFRLARSPLLQHLVDQPH